ncbi:MAG: benzoate 1,2-dioxygenase electron transfer component BenC [Corynebacterium sp.]|uniref:benzoate 1,2-dioxygenase electron transfer component BenC n=1 Tax=Corynebacterium sp. TaxID=1720 RepID=UPI0026DF3E01|nr:benzoate 1,2-dioxygenase electron transfer component BenC [Corynebacterium sp.]MDO5669984.1 benzoate 1,2-dioxygenase electron transfer component BenC [Corynebacterium sp.]
MTHQIALAFEDGITRFIECEEDQTVADAAYQARINIPFDCRDGACGTCKSFCESGDYDEGEYIEDALSEDEAAEGYILTCQTKPFTDMVVQIATTSVLAKTGASTLVGTITELERLSESTVKFAVQIEDRKSLNYLPGQYMNISPPNSDFHRSYSFSSGPSEDIVTFLVKLTRGGLMSEYLTDTAKVGDRLNLTGPMGSFFLREPVNPILLLAGGTGLAPIMSILEKLAEDELLDVPVRLIYGATFDHDIVELEKIESFKDRLPDFDYFTVVSDPESDNERKGYVTQHMTEEHLHDGEADVYLCGPPPMVEAVRTFLNDQENPPQNFYYEKFSSAAGTTGDSTVTADVATTDTSASVTISAPGVETGQVHRLDDDARSIFDARMALELGVVTLVADILDEEDFTAFRELAEKANSYIDGEKLTDVAGYVEANNAYHEFLFQRSGNDAMLQAYRTLDVPKVMGRELEDAGFMHADIADEHVQIIDALEAKDLGRVRELLRAHNDHAVHTMDQAVAAKASV